MAMWEIGLLHVDHPWSTYRGTSRVKLNAVYFVLATAYAMPPPPDPFVHFCHDDADIVDP
jgi:hypothetical protein